jgi:AcrR family transcriptional regulator
LKHRSDEKRQAILEAAFRVVSERGYYETRVDDIAAAAGVAKGTVYLYFKDKPEVYAGLVLWLMQQAEAIVHEVAARPGSAADRLRTVFETWAEGVLARPGVLALVSMENINVTATTVKRLHDTALPQMQELVGDIARLIKQGIASGEFRPVDSRLAAMLCLQSFRGTVLVSRGRASARAAADAALDILFNGLVRPVTARRKTKRS